MPPRSALDIGQIPRSCHQIEQVDDVERCRHPKRGMVQARSRAIGKRHVMHAALAVHPCRPKPPRLVVFGVFRHPKSDGIIKGHAGVHIRGEDVEVINPQWFDAFIERVFLVDRRQPVHLDVKFQGDPEHVLRPQASAHEGPLHPFHGEVLRGKPCGGFVQIGLIIKLEPQNAGIGDGGFPQRDAMMPSFLECAQIHALFVFISDLEAQCIDVKRL